MRKNLIGFSPHHNCSEEFHDAWDRIGKTSKIKSVYECFHEWRKENRLINNWGLAWFLANEFCKRFYASHGIIPQVTSHEGLGYYGITLDKTHCAVHNQEKEFSLGRFSMFGDVENWSTGGPGDHGFNATELCENGEKIDNIVKMAISHMRLSAIPTKTHLNCRHKRWGSSYQLLFEIATILAMKYDHETIEIWNHPYHTQRFIDKLDTNSKMNEHLGAFLFRHNDTEIVFACDGRELSGTQDENYWHQYMSGESSYELCGNLSKKLKL